FYNQRVKISGGERKVERPVVSFEVLVPAWVDDRGGGLEIYLGSALKWTESTGYLGSVFSCSNDRGATPQMERICRYLQQVAAEHPVSLVSVIGGSYFLDFVAAADFTRIILFDKNVAEFSKICAFCDILSRDPAADPVGGLEQEILAAPERLLPSLPSSNLSAGPGPESDWKFEGRSEPAFPLVLRQGNFPEYAWSANEEERRRTLANLRRALAKDVYLEEPEVDADGHLVVVFCSNANSSDFPDYYIRPRFQNAAGVLIVRSIVVNNNEAALDPHPYWEAIARSQCTGRSHQLWAPVCGHPKIGFVLIRRSMRPLIRPRFSAKRRFPAKPIPCCAIFFPESAAVISRADSS
ncbi:MAG: hypothetical protein ACK6DY_00400, partial [Acidobacteriota bacterium]